MIKGNGQIADELYALLKDSAIRRAITGTITKAERPLDSKNEDITIAVVATQPREIQTAIVNVNLFVPMQRTAQQYSEDTKRTKVLCPLLINALNEVNCGEFRTSVTAVDFIQDKDSKTTIISAQIYYQTTTN